MNKKKNEFFIQEIYYFVVPCTLIIIPYKEMSSNMFEHILYFCGIHLRIKKKKTYIKFTYIYLSSYFFISGKFICDLLIISMGDYNFWYFLIYGFCFIPF